MTDVHLENLDFILEQYGGGISPFLMCPPALFAEIIQINHLRTRAARQEAGVEGPSQDAFRILGRIDGFSPEHWAESKPSSEGDWILLGAVYQAAVAIYCIYSLQSLFLLPTTPSLRAHCTTYGRLLQALLNEALSSPRIKRFMLWPLAMLGMEAVTGSAATRAFVEKQLSETSRHVGTYAPLTAKAVLERFWASGETRWDACFDKPYVFAILIAVDLSSVLPLRQS